MIVCIWVGRGAISCAIHSASNCWSAGIFMVYTNVWGIRLWQDRICRTALLLPTKCGYVEDEWVGRDHLRLVVSRQECDVRVYRVVWWTRVWLCRKHLHTYKMDAVVRYTNVYPNRLSLWYAWVCSLAHTTIGTNFHHIHVRIDIITSQI